MQRSLFKILLAIIPAIIALIAVRYEPALTLWASRREAVLPVGIFLLLSLVLHPALRQILVVTLCYGVAFMAIRDIGRVGSIPLPQSINYDFIDQSRPAVLGLVAALSGIAAIAESFQPGTVWARRCYFGSAALYFTGLGIIHYGSHGSWQTLVLCGTGITALIGCIMAHKIVAFETDVEDEAEVSDESIQERADEKHRLKLREKEWHDRQDQDSGPHGAPALKGL